MIIVSYVKFHMLIRLTSVKIILPARIYSGTISNFKVALDEWMMFL